ncbi:MAG TPA: FliH/SctL family protein [Candidatus Baltobacteraceae bacterium]|jgi:flagellar biosynthesis/type III secretory pathway protein FliH
MSESFQSLASLLACKTDCVEPVGTETVEVAANRPLPARDEFQELSRDVTFFHVHLREALERAVDVLLRDIAADVLARELRLAPADIGGIVERALLRYRNEEPLRIRVHPDDASAATHASIPIELDRKLRCGDAVIELRDGSVDASLGVRLADVLRRPR